MSFVKGKERFIVQLQPPQQAPLSVDQRVLLIRNVRKYPRMYKNEFLRTPFLHRNEKQQMWDKIAEESGFEKNCLQIFKGVFTTTSPYKKEGIGNNSATFATSATISINIYGNADWNMSSLCSRLKKNISKGPVPQCRNATFTNNLGNRKLIDPITGRQTDKVSKLFLGLQNTFDIVGQVINVSKFSLEAEDAKCKWRSLISYLRQHLDNVAQKKTRRYIPISDNPDDKYVQLTDWPFYSELQFLVPYVKYAASKQFGNAPNRLEITPGEIDLILEGIEAEIEKKNKEKETQVLAQEVKQNRVPNEDIQEIQSNRVEIIDNTENDLTENDKILKEYFENMLKSTLKLPRFHQNLIKQQLQDCINEQKVLNKIN